jgi:isoleucyl-tRNA synthetase
MSKRLKNYPDPSAVMDSYGSDALRLYLINSPVVRAETLRFKESGVKEIVSKVLLPLWNSYQFFEQQVALLKKVADLHFVFDPEAEKGNTNVLDRWILASCQSLLKFVNEVRCNVVITRSLLINPIGNGSIQAVHCSSPTPHGTLELISEIIILTRL